MGAAQCSGKKLHPLDEVAVTDEARVELAVEHRGVRCDFESASEPAPVGNGDHQHLSAPDARNACRDFAPPISEQLPQRGVDVNGVTLEKSNPIAGLEY